MAKTLTDLEPEGAGTARKIPVSCFIIAMNEADRIARTIDSVRDLVDEIIVVDSGSRDDTVKIAEDLGCTVLYRDWEGYGPQKRFGETACRNDLVLNLDADEVITPALAAEIRALFAQGGPKASFYRFRLLTVYPGDEKPRPFADYHNYIRLYDRRAGRFSKSAVHDLVDPGDRPVMQLKSTAWHYSYRSLSHLIEKLNGYTDLQAATGQKSGPLLPVRIVFEMPLTFLKYYFLQRHFTGGIRGFVFAMTIASFKVFRLAKMGRLV